MAQRQLGMWKNGYSKLQSHTLNHAARAVDGWMLFGNIFVQVMKSPTPLMHCAFTAV